MVLETRGVARSLPVDLLYKLLLLDDQTLGDFFRSYLSQCVDLYVRTEPHDREASPPPEATAPGTNEELAELKHEV